jgi:tRNA G26 N,N-dimethylase Trm1
MGTARRIESTLRNLLNEEKCQQPLSYDVHRICGDIGHMQVPSGRQIVAGFQSLNLQATQTYYDPKLWKFDAPP